MIIKSRLGVNVNKTSLTWFQLNKQLVTRASKCYCVKPHIAGLHVSKLRFYLSGSFFLLTQAEKRAFSQLQARLSAEVRKKKEPQF